MGSELRSIDITNMPELARLTDEVLATTRPVALQRNHETVAVLKPARRSARPR